MIQRVLEKEIGKQLVLANKKTFLPVSFKNAYPGTPFTVVTPANMEDFLL